MQQMLAAIPKHIVYGNRSLNRGTQRFRKLWLCCWLVITTLACR